MRPYCTAGPQRPHTLSLGLRGGFFGRQCVSWHPARSNTLCTSRIIRARACGDRTCVLMTALWLCWSWVPTGSAKSLVFLPTQRTVVGAVCARDVYPTACYSLVSTCLFVYSPCAVSPRQKRYDFIQNAINMTVPNPRLGGRAFAGRTTRHHPCITDSSHHE